MCFQFVETTWKDLEFYTPPYFKNKKFSQENKFRIINIKTEFDQVFEVIKSFFNSEKVFNEYEKYRELKPVKKL